MRSFRRQKHQKRRHSSALAVNLAVFQREKNDRSASQADEEKVRILSPLAYNTFFALHNISTPVSHAQFEELRESPRFVNFRFIGCQIGYIFQAPHG